jgi:Prolyl oligopeptidase family.
MFETGGQLEELANNGYCVAAIDNRYHGERNGPDYKQELLTEAGHFNLLKLRKAIKESADDINMVINKLIEMKSIDEQRIAVIGVSMGGFITYRALISNTKIKVGIPIIASPYWDDIPGELAEQINKDLQMDELSSYSNSFQPAEKMDCFYPRALLLQIGEDDRHYNVSKVKEFYHSLKEYYMEQPERLKLITYEKTGHEFTTQMWQTSVEWLHQFL